MSSTDDTNRENLDLGAFWAFAVLTILWFGWQTANYNVLFSDYSRLLS